MSNKQLINPANSIEKLREELKGLSPIEVIKKLMEMQTKQLYKFYGRYESPSGQMFFEMWHNADPNHLEAGSVRFRKGLTRETEYEEDSILERGVAVQKMGELIKKGYQRIIEAVTENDLDEGNRKRLENLSQAKREGIIGILYRGEQFFRVNEFGDSYSIEYGWRTNTSNAEYDLTYEAARTAYDKAIEEGYSKDNSYVAPEESLDDIFAGL